MEILCSLGQSFATEIVGMFTKYYNLLSVLSRHLPVLFQSSPVDKHELKFYKQAAYVNIWFQKYMIGILVMY